MADTAEPIVHNPDLLAPGLPDTVLDAALMVPFDVKSAVERLELLQGFFKAVMKEGQDYGPPFPGSKAKQLYTSGADKLCQFFGVYDRSRCTHRVEQWGLTSGERPFLHFEFEADLISYRTGRIVAVGIGSANSLEQKYRYRKTERKCPECQAPAIFRSKFIERGATEKGWYCNKNKDGCGAQFPPNDERIIKQEVGRIENLQIQELHHTILRIATKRAKVHGVAKIASTLGLLLEAGKDEEEDDVPDDGDDKRGGKPEIKAGDPKGKSAELIGVSEVERKKLYETYTAAGHQQADVIKWIQQEHGIDITRQALPKKIYEKVMERVAKPEPLVAF